MKNKIDKMIELEQANKSQCDKYVTDSNRNAHHSPV